MRRTTTLLAAMVLTSLLLASGVALAVNKVGTDGPDTLRGTNEADNLSGGGGNDDIFGLGGSDNLLGGEGKDWVLGGNERRPQGGDKNLLGGPGNDGVLGGDGSDAALGGSGNDLVEGGNGSDDLTGDSGNDWVYGHRGSDDITGDRGADYLLDGPFRETDKDTLSGGDGDDVFFVDNRPATRDVVTCGGGFDRVAADTKDVIADDCEEVAVGPAALQEFYAGLEEEGFFENLYGVLGGLAPFPGE